MSTSTRKTTSAARIGGLVLMIVPTPLWWMLISRPGAGWGGVFFVCIVTALFGYPGWRLYRQSQMVDSVDAAPETNSAQIKLDRLKAIESGERHGVWLLVLAAIAAFLDYSVSTSLSGHLVGGGFAAVFLVAWLIQRRVVTDLRKNYASITAQVDETPVPHPNRHAPDAAAQARVVVQPTDDAVRAHAPVVDSAASTAKEWPTAEPHNLRYPQPVSSSYAARSLLSRVIGVGSLICVVVSLPMCFDSSADSGITQFIGMVCLMLGLLGLGLAYLLRPRP